jgi:soluble lytic murein transglycosylase
MTRATNRLVWWVAAAILLLVFGFYRVGDLRWQRREHRYDDLFLQASRTSGVPFTMVKAVAWRESRFIAEARGRHGEIGLMQITEIAAQEWADAHQDTNFIHEHVLDPTTNVLAATHYLSKLVKRYGGTDNPWAFALADYNAGRSHVVRWMEGEARTNSQAFLEAITFPGTRRYVMSVLDRAAFYERELYVTDGGRPIEGAP